MMSTKIWTANRVPLNRLNEYLPLCRDTTLAHIIQELEYLLERLNWSVLAPTLESEIQRRIQSFNNPSERTVLRIRKTEQMEFLCNDKFRAAANSHEKSMFNFDASFNVFIDVEESFAYLIPYDKAVLAQTEYASDFHYQNQVSEDDISEEEMQHRRTVWERLGLDDWGRQRLCYEVLNFGGTHYVHSGFVLMNRMGLYV